MIDFGVGRLVRGDSVYSKNLNFVPGLGGAGEHCMPLYRVACFCVSMLLPSGRSAQKPRRSQYYNQSRGSQGNEGLMSFFLSLTSLSITHRSHKCSRISKIISSFPSLSWDFTGIIASLYEARFLCAATEGEQHTDTKTSDSIQRHAMLSRTPQILERS